jgi:hypothetical protein
MADDDLDSDRERPTIRELLEELIRKVDGMSEGLVALQETVATLTTEDEQLTAVVAAAVTGIATIEQQLEALKDQGGTSDAELAPVTAAVTAAASTLQTAIASLQGATPAEPTPAEPTRLKPTYIHDVEGDTTGWTLAGLDVPAVGAVPAGPEGEPEVPAKPAVPLWYFDADPEGADATPTGAVEGVWTVYTGPVVAAE